MGKRKMVFSLGRTRILEMNQGRRSSALQGMKQEAVTEFVTGTMLRPVTIGMHVG